MFIEVTLCNGEKQLLNLDVVESIKREENGCMIYYQDDLHQNVKDSYEELKKKILG